MEWIQIVMSLFIYLRILFNDFDIIPVSLNPTLALIQSRSIPTMVIRHIGQLKLIQTLPKVAWVLDVFKDFGSELVRLQNGLSIHLRLVFLDSFIQLLVFHLFI